MTDVLIRAGSGLAARYVGDRTIEVAASDGREPSPSEVRIDVAYTGICGTDLHILHGAMDARVATPAVIGHETAGRISAVGADVVDWQVGDPVTVMPLAWCGTCPACRAGYRHICHRLDFMGIDSPGAMQQAWTVPASSLVRLPGSMSLRSGALIEPTAVAVHDVRRAELRPGERVLVVGGGPVGLLIALVARAAGAETMVLELDAFRRGVARSLGLQTLDPTSDDIPAAIETWTEGAGAAVAFEVSGSEAGLGLALAQLATRGRLVMVAIHPQPKPIDLFRIFWRELTIIGARVYERADFERAVELVADGRVDVAPLISTVVPLTEAASAFAALEQQAGVLKVLIDCRGTAS